MSRATSRAAIRAMPCVSDPVVAPARPRPTAWLMGEDESGRCSSCCRSARTAQRRWPPASANGALVRAERYASEVEMLAAVNDIGNEGKCAAPRSNSQARMQRDGRAVDFGLGGLRYRTRERSGARERARVHAADGRCGAMRARSRTSRQRWPSWSAGYERRFPRVHRCPQLHRGATRRVSVLYASPAAQRLIGHAPAEPLHSRVSTGCIRGPGERAARDAGCSEFSSDEPRNHLRRAPRRRRNMPPAVVTTTARPTRRCRAWC